MLALIFSFIREYWDDILEYIFGSVFMKLGVINIIALFLEKYGFTFDYSYFGACGGFIWWMITKSEEQKLKEQGLPYKKVTIFRAFLYLFLSMFFAVFFTSIFHNILPSISLATMAVLTGLFWENAYLYLKKIYMIATKGNSNVKSNFNEEDSEHPPRPGG